MPLPIRRVTALGMLVVVIGAMFLTWSTRDGGQAGTQTGEGQLVAIVALLTMVLTRIGWRPAWIGAGFIVATLVRQVQIFGGDTGVGLYIALAAAAAAAVALIMEFFSQIERADDPV